MPETQSTTTTQATTPTGDIKVFVDTFNKEFDNEVKKLTESVNNLKTIYNDSIKISTPRTSTWPNDVSVKTIGDLFKYTFPDIDKGTFIKPPDFIISTGGNSYVDEQKKTDYKSWEKDMTSTDVIKEMFASIKRGLRGVDKLNDYNNVKKPGITNPNLYSPGQYYFDVFMSLMLDEDGPIKSPDNGNGGERAFDRDFLKLNGGSASISIFDSSGEIDIAQHETNADYYEFYQIIDGGYSGVGVKYKISSLTGIDIDLDGDSTKNNNAFPGLRVQYRSGKLEELKKDPKFNLERGEISSTDPTEFIGNYEQLLLYKAFVQAGDNYKPLVLPLREVKTEPVSEITEPATKPAVIEEPVTDEIVFNVEKTDIFVIVGGTQSGKEFTVVKSDTVSPPVVEDNTGRTDNFIDSEDLDEEYLEEPFAGFDENGVVFLEPTSFKSDYSPTSDDAQSSVTDTNSLSGPVEIPAPKEGEMTISKEGLKKLKAHEGSRATVYDDATGSSISSWSCKGFATIGVGHLVKDNEKTAFSKYLKPGKMSDTEIEKLLLSDLVGRISALNKKITVKVSQGQFDALLSMGFNTGFGNKSFLKAVALTNEGRKQDASRQIASGPKTSKGKELAGLVRRRNEEAEWYLRTDLG